MAIMRDTNRFLHFNLAHTGNGEDNHYVDLGKLLSQSNLRTYRQGLVYHVANIVFDDAGGDADIDVCTMPNTWYTQYAWKVGFQQWMFQQRAALEATSLDKFGPWHDYKIHLNADAISDADQAALIDVNGNTFPTGDWDYSQYVVPQSGSDDPHECPVTMMGETAGTFPAITRISLLEEFFNVRNKVQEDPDMNDPDDSAWALLSADASDPEVLPALMDDLEDDNDLPPYSNTEIPGRGSAGAGYPASPWVARTCMIKGGGSTSSPVAAVGGFAAPCGLLMIETNAGADNSIGCTIELVPGEYKGVHAYPMRGGGF